MVAHVDIWGGSMSVHQDQANRAREQRRAQAHAALIKAIKEARPEPVKPAAPALNSACG